jgi:hypothetical protein
MKNFIKKLRRVKMSDIRKVLILDHRDIKTLAKHKYAELAYTTDAMLDLWNEIVDQILEQ